MAPQQDADLVLTTDVDMFPLNNDFLAPAINECIRDPQAFIVVRDVLAPGQFPICYSLASPAVWGTVFGEKSDAEINLTLKSLFDGRVASESYVGSRGGEGWYVDQQYLFERVTAASEAGEISLVLMDDSQTGHKRLDRSRHRGLLRWKVLVQVAISGFSDYHVHHPMSKNLPYIASVWLVSALSRFVAIALRRLWGYGDN